MGAQIIQQIEVQPNKASANLPPRRQRQRNHFYNQTPLDSNRKTHLTPPIPHTIKHLTSEHTHHHTTPTGKTTTIKQPEAHATRKGLQENVICYFFPKNAPPRLKKC
jgi:hypothetical protein